MGDYIYNRTYTNQEKEESKVYTMLEEIAKLANQVNASGIADINNQFDNINSTLQAIMTSIITINQQLTLQQSVINNLSIKINSLENATLEIKKQNEEILEDIVGVDNGLNDILGAWFHDKN